MTIKQAIECVRIALGDRDEHHPNCNVYRKHQSGNGNLPCDCYASRRQLPHKALDLIEQKIKQGKGNECP
jgi:hypothetical protein